MEARASSTTKYFEAESMLWTSYKLLQTAAPWYTWCYACAKNLGAEPGLGCLGSLVWLTVSSAFSLIFRLLIR